MALDAASKTPPSPAQCHLYRSGRARPEREAVARILDGSSGHLLEAHRAPFFEHGQRGVNRSRNHGGIETFAIEVLMAGSIPIDSRAFGRPTLPDNGRYFTFAAWI